MRNSCIPVFNDWALAELCRLLELKEPAIAPDAVWFSGYSEHYIRLWKLETLAISRELAVSIVCPDCNIGSIRPQMYRDTAFPEITYRGYCLDCGWIELMPEQSHYWKVLPDKLAYWLSMGLGLTRRNNIEPLINGTFWKLGEMEFRRHRRTVFFGRRLQDAPETILSKLSQLVAPGAEIIITPGDSNFLRSTVLGDRLIVPLRAIAHIRKSGFVIENLDAFLLGPAPIEESTETSLRFIHTKRIAMIDGKKHKLSPMVYKFLAILLEADGDEVHKSHIAKGFNIEASNLRVAELFKRHKDVYATFVRNDRKRNYWIPPEFLISEGRC